MILLTKTEQEAEKRTLARELRSSGKCQLVMSGLGTREFENYHTLVFK